MAIDKLTTIASDTFGVTPLQGAFRTASYGGDALENNNTATLDKNLDFNNSM